MADEEPTQALCPTCEKPTRLTKSNPWRPFCSERCKLIDLGEWFEENYRIDSQSNTATSISEVSEKNGL